MKRHPCLRSGPGLRFGATLAAMLAATALAFPSPARSTSDPCDFDGEWPQIQFGRSGKTVTRTRELEAPVPHGVWHVDAGENGSASIAAGEEEAIHICAQIVAWAKDERRAQALARAIRIESNGRGIHAEGPEQTRSERWAVSYRVLAPRKIDLGVEAINGAVEVVGVRGSIRLHTVNGPLRVAEAGGDIRGTTTNGPVAIRLSGSRWSGRGLDLETVNGPVKISIPKDYSATLETGTRHGPMDTAFPVANRMKMRGRISTVLGSGGPPIRAVTTNGPVKLEVAD